MTLRDLLERVERATGPDAVLDKEIVAACKASSLCRECWGLGGYNRGDGRRCERCNRNYADAVTSSVDAALALIGRVQPDAELELCYRRGALRCVKWWSPARNIWIIYEKPLALCAALLAAMIEQEGSSRSQPSRTSQEPPNDIQHSTGEE